MIDGEIRHLVGWLACFCFVCFRTGVVILEFKNGSCIPAVYGKVSWACCGTGVD